MLVWFFIFYKILSLYFTRAVKSCFLLKSRGESLPASMGVGNGLHVVFVLIGNRQDPGTLGDSTV